MIREEEIRWQHSLALSLGGYKSFVMDGELQRLPHTPRLHIVRLAPERVQCVALCHWFGLYPYHLCSWVKTFYLTRNIWIVASEVIHVFQPMRLKYRYTQPLWHSYIFT